MKLLISLLSLYFFLFYNTPANETQMIQPIDQPNKKKDTVKFHSENLPNSVKSVSLNFKETCGNLKFVRSDFSGHTFIVLDPEKIKCNFDETFNEICICKYEESPLFRFKGYPTAKIKNSILAKLERMDGFQIKTNSIFHLDNSGFFVCNANPKIQIYSGTLHLYEFNPQDDIDSCEYDTELEQKGQNCLYNSHSFKATFLDESKKILVLVPRTKNSTYDSGHYAPDVQGEFSQINKSLDSFCSPKEKLEILNFFGFKLDAEAEKNHDIRYPTPEHFITKFNELMEILESGGVNKKLQNLLTVPYLSDGLETNENYLRNIKNNRIPIGRSGHLYYHDLHFHFFNVFFNQNPAMLAYIKELALLGEQLQSLPSEDLKNSNLKSLISHIDTLLTRRAYTFNPEEEITYFKENNIKELPNPSNLKEIAAFNKKLENFKTGVYFYKEQDSKISALLKSRCRLIAGQIRAKRFSQK